MAERRRIDWCIVCTKRKITKQNKNITKTKQNKKLKMVRRESIGTEREKRRDVWSKCRWWWWWWCATIASIKILSSTPHHQSSSTTTCQYCLFCYHFKMSEWEYKKRTKVPSNVERERFMPRATLLCDSPPVVYISYIINQQLFGLVVFYLRAMMKMKLWKTQSVELS